MGVIIRTSNTDLVSFVANGLVFLLRLYRDISIKLRLFQTC